jgi:drug/metabolite transporter (DMT)-like permease
VLFSSLPLFVALVTPLMTGAVVPRRAVFSMVIALGGMAVLFYTGLSASPDLLLGGAAVLVAILSSAWAVVYAKREISAVNPLLSSTVQFVVSAAVLFLGSLLLERDRPSDWNRTSVLALLFLAVVGSAIAFSVYYWLLSQLQAYQVSTTNLVIPIVAIAEGALLLQERVPLLMIAASAVVLIAVAVVLRAEDDPDLRLGIDVPAEH